MTGRIVAVVALTGFLVGLSFATFSEMRIFLPAMLRGAIVTLQVSVLSALLFFVMSFVAGIAKDSRVAPVRWLAIAYIEVFRGTSLLVQLFWLYFVLPEFGVVLSPMTAGVLGVGFNFGAYGAEIVRGAMAAVPRGQLEPDVTAVRAPHAAARVAEGGRIDQVAGPASRAAYDHGEPRGRPLFESRPVTRAFRPSHLAARPVNPSARMRGKTAHRPAAQAAARHGG